MAFGGLGDLMKMMGQMGKVRELVAQAQERAARRTVEGEAGGGLVKVTANGAGDVLSMRFEAEALNDPESLGPLAAAAVNAALRKGREAMQEEAQALLGGLDLPPGVLGQIPPPPSAG
jgi:DNA-binding YbaB/EbfC family protein